METTRTDPNDRTRPDDRGESADAACEDVCNAREVHAGTLDGVRGAMPPDADLFYLAELFKVLGDHTRTRILSALALAELCVCDLAELLGMSHSAVSHQLRALRAARLVRFRREGKNAYYALDDDHVLGLIRQGLEHVRHG
ncbi:transcriptional regulator, ArsR family [Desulfovibrio sp. X2]|uniref:ArsR/SmtB family transcription factor n=1 Tax=Desulfovibrio sp. X2 TaxID=941449 RepID=UPI00035870F6|nr:metalloregulator ArsR/SmtB family transcription factor [Desulfovibrio sp. X2]EPR43716.1 transcriptional regulator, ArsR family [Desulfovibrio sp. X2]